GPRCPTCVPYTTLFRSMVGVALWTLLTNIYKSWQRADESPVETLVWCVVHTLPAGVLNTVLAMIPMIVLGPQRASLISSQLVMRSEEHTSELQSRFDLV